MTYGFKKTKQKRPTVFVKLIWKCPGWAKLTPFLSNIQLQDPEVMAAFQDVAQNPANISKYQNNPKIMALVTKLSSKFGAPPQP